MHIKKYKEESEWFDIESRKYLKVAYYITYLNVYIDVTTIEQDRN